MPDYTGRPTPTAFGTSPKSDDLYFESAYIQTLPCRIWGSLGGGKIAPQEESIMPNNDSKTYIVNDQLT